MHRPTRVARPAMSTSVGQPVAAVPSGPCRIKGNISDSGKIYHVPGSPWYERTEINESKGERWFCTEEQARAAGWRPPKQ